MERRRLLPALPALLAALLLAMAAPAGADFTASCPAECRCTWVSGKKQADCSGRQEVGLPLELSPEVQVLDLSGAEVPRLERDALLSAGLEHLQTLLLRGVRLRHLDKHALRGLHLLTRLDLSENLLTADQLDAETFADNPKLLQLSLAGNPLQRLDELQLPDLPQLQRLNLSHCQLASVSARAFRRLPALKYLHLDGNKLAVLDPVLFQSLGQLRSLTLHGNPWRCDCHLRLFRDWLVQHGLYQEGTWCVEPERLVGRRWTDARSEEFACRPQITIPEPTVVADVGQNVTLPCQISGSPAADTKWVLSGGRILRNNTPIPFTRQVYIIHDEGNVNRWTNLTITHVTEQDAGQYLCVGSNPGGVVEHNVTLVFRTAAVGTPGPVSGPLSGPVLIGALAGGAALLLLLLLLCCWCCCCRRRGAPDKEAPAGDGVMVISGQKAPRMGEYEKLPQTDVELGRLRAATGGEPSSSVMCDATEPAGRPRRRSSLPDPAAEDARRDYPDLLHLPRRGGAGAEAAADPRLGAAALAPRHRPRPAYVTLPRRPRTPSWGSALPDPVYDTLGPRTTVDGSSRLSLTSVGAERPPVYYLPVESVPEPALFSSLPRPPRAAAPPPLACHVRSLSSDLIEPLHEEPEESEEPPPPPPPPEFNGTPPGKQPPPPPPPKPKKVTPPVLPKTELNGGHGFQPFQDETAEDGTEV